MFNIWVYCILFIPSSVDGCLLFPLFGCCELHCCEGPHVRCMDICFNFSWVNTYVRTVTKSYGNSIPANWETDWLFSQGASPFNFPTDSVWRSWFHHILVGIYYDMSFQVILFGMRWHIIWFWFAFMSWLMLVEYFFLSLLVICLSSLEKYLFRSVALLKLDYSSLLLWRILDIFIFWICKSLIRCMICRYFLPFRGFFLFSFSL